MCSPQELLASMVLPEEGRTISSQNRLAMDEIVTNVYP